MIRKIISFICLLSIFIESVPVNALSYGISDIISQETTESNSNNDTVDKKTDSDKTANSNDNNEKSDSKDNDKEVISNLEDNTFNAYINGENELAFSIGFDKKERKFIVKKQSEKQLAKDKLDTIIYKISVYDKENKEKLNVELLGSDTGNTEKLNILNETKYEIGDTIKITPLDPKNGLKILGDIQGDIDNNKEDYSDGVDNLDYIDNVRFEITENNLKTVYNEAPVFEGLTDLLNVEDPNVDVFQGVKVKDDHDGEIDNSKIVVSVQEKTETSAILTYTVQDSWGRNASGTRKISAPDSSNTDKSQNNPTTYSGGASNQALTNNVITVEGIPYAGDIKERFKIKFDPVSKSIKITDEDGRVFSNSEKDEYFKFVLYDKDMEVKSSVTLLGSDKSDSEKLEAINNYLYEEGDYIGIWHAESDTKLKIAGTVKQTVVSNGQANPNSQTVDYSNGLPKKEISERRFRIQNTGLEEVNNKAPKIGELESKTIARGEELDLLADINGKVSDDFDTFNDENLEKGNVSITHTPFDNAKVGTQTVTYTATDKWGRSSTKDRTITVTSENPLDYTYIELKKNNGEENNSESLFKIKIDAVKKQLYVDNLENIEDTPIDPSKKSSIFKLKVYTQDGILQKTLNIKGTDKLKTVLRRINGYTYNTNDRIELWSITPKNIIVSGSLVEANNENSKTDATYVPNENNTDGENSGEYKENYENGIDNDDYMKNVRFEIGSTNLKYIYNEAPKFTISTELTAERNGQVDYMNGITASDDHDNNVSNNITYTEISTSTIGEKYVEYKVVDSWGRATLIRRKVTVYPYNSLEYNYITVKNSETNDPILSIKFDENNKKFNVNKLDVSKIPSSLDGTDELLKLKLIRTNGNTKTNNNPDVITVTKNNLTSNNGNDIVNKINELSYNHGDYISLKVYDSLNGILISGKSHIVLNGFTSEDEMSNSRFKINAEGLQIEYNEAPVFSGLDNKLYLYKGNTLNENYAKSGITVTDDIDQTIESENITITNLETIKTKANEIGEYTLDYQVTDSWGRSTSGSRTLAVISKSVSNDIEFYDKTNTNTKLFSLKFNPVKNGFDVTRDTTGIQNAEALKRNSEETTPQNGGSNTPSEGEDSSQTEVPKVFKLYVYNAQGKEIGKLELTEEGIKTPNAFDVLDNITVSDNYYFSVWSDTPSRIKIKGHMTGNNRLGEDENQNENYSNGIVNEDHMNNVRFKLKTDGLEAVYNKAPKINLSRERFIEFAGDPIDYLRGVTVSDDHDEEIPTENVKVDIVENNREDTLTIGENTVTLTVKDSWGREGRTDRDITIKNGIDKNTIRFLRTPSNPNSKVLDIGFNHETKKLNLTTYNNGETFGPGTVGDYVKIRVKRPNSTGADTTRVDWIKFNSNENPNNSQSKLNRLKEYIFEYGDYFEIYHGHPSRFFIEGKVTDSREDYTDGVQNPENILNIKFEITKSGLKAVYTNPDKDNINGNSNIIGPMAPEKFPFKLKVNPTERTIRVIDRTATKILASAGNSLVYKVVLIGENGTIKKTLTLNGDHWGHSYEGIDEWYNNPVSFNYGDALYVWHKEPSRSIIKGNIKKQREDYSNGVDDPDNMNHVVFKLTESGLESVYNEAPTINGIEDKDLYPGQMFNPSEGVRYSDDHDRENQLITSITGGDNVNTNEPREHTITYTARDRWNKTTTVERKVTVRPNLYKNIFKIYTDTNSGTEPNRQTDPNTETRKPAFEIGFDSVTNKYRVFNQSNDRLSRNNPEDIVFGIQIKGSDGNVKKEITLTGNDRGNSDKLNELKEVTYSNGDIIRIYRRNLDAISISGDVTGNIPSSEDMTDKTNKFDYMKNTGFKVSNEGLEAVYNKAPVLNGVNKEKTITKGTVDLLNGLTVLDELDENVISTDNIIVRINGETIKNKNSHTFDKLGTYKVEYILTDSWGRSVLQYSTITVESKVKENSIEVYGPNDTLAFKVKFNTTENKFELVGSEDNSTSTYTSSSNQKGYFEMIVRNIKGEEKYNVTLNGNAEHDRAKLATIHQQGFDKYDTISLHGHDPDTVKIKGNVISRNSTRSNDSYSNGFGTTDKYSKVRFKITDEGLKEMTKKDPTISGLDPKTIKRGDEIDFLEGVVVDVKDQNNEDYKITVDKNGFDKLTEGTYTVTYTVTNSWGSSVKKNREITVEPRTELEKVKFNLKNTNGGVILTIGFDSIQKKLRVFNYTNNATVDSGNTSTAFTINIYDSLGNTLSTLELNGTQQINEDIVNQIKNFDYIEGYRLNVWANNPQIHLDLEGNINISNPETRKILRNTDSIDKMENGRFEVLESGLTYIYNQAPTISGGDTPISYYKGKILSLPEDIKVSDDHDKISKNQVVIDDDNVDYDGLGLFDITYMVEDTWGRVGTKEGKINIKSSMDSNVISIYPKSNTTTTRNGDTINTDNSAFDIKFFRDEAEHKNKIKIEKKNNNAELNPSNPEDTFMNIKIYGANGKEKKSVNLLGNDTVNSKKLTKLDKLNNFEYDRGDYIAIEGVTEDTKSCIKIQGTVVNQKEDYTNGVENLDNIQNVRFKFTDFGLESVYNEAPTIIIDESINLDAAKGDDIPYMRGVKLKDDHDKLTKDNVEVTWNPNDALPKYYEPYNDVIKGLAKVGENELQYKVTDSWGRTSVGSRTVNLTNAILKNSILFKILNKTDMAKFTFEEVNDDASNNQITLKVQDLNTTDIVAQNRNINYYTVKITKPNGDFYTRSVYSNDRYTNQFDVFNNMKLPYGSIIEFTETGHPDRLSISGPVRNQREDYSDGVNDPQNLRDVIFEVTDSGLKSVYDPKDQRQENQNIITVVSKESIPLKLKIDPTSKTISHYHSTSSTFYWELLASGDNLNGHDQEVFRITLKGKDGRTKFEKFANSREKGTDFVKNKFAQPQEYDIGDTLTIWHKAPNRISIQGKVDGAREDYTDGVDNSKNLEEAVFTLKEDGLEAVYKEAPKILGLKDTKILKGEGFDGQKLNELITDLRATDSIDGVYENKVIVGETSQLNEVPNGTIVIDPTSVKTNKVGMYEVKYTVTNSNDRTTRKSSTVVVYDRPTINEANTRIELNSVENRDEAIKERLKEAVSVTDDDDELYKKETKLEVLSHTVNPNVENTYTARYRATDMYGEVTERDVNISVTRTINVSVPTTIPFQVVTNLTNENADEFISGVMKVQNNNTSDVNVSIKSFTRQESTTTKNKNYEELQIVKPDRFPDWNNISKEDSMTKMALGIYNKAGLTVDSKLQLTEQEPLWLEENMDAVKLGVLNRATDLNTPYTSKLSFTSKHGKNFKGGTSRGKFNLVFRFE